MDAFLSHGLLFFHATCIYGHSVVLVACPVAGAPCWWSASIGGLSPSTVVKNHLKVLPWDLRVSPRSTFSPFPSRALELS